MSKVPANERRRYICNVFSHWLGLCSVRYRGGGGGGGGSAFFKYLLLSLISIMFVSQASLTKRHRPNVTNQTSLTRRHSKWQTRSREISPHFRVLAMVLVKWQRLVVAPPYGSPGVGVTIATFASPLQVFLIIPKCRMKSPSYVCI